MNTYESLADDFYINMNLNTEMELPRGRETILGFLERVNKQYPTMRNFHTRETGDFVLEEDKDQGQQRWLTVEARRVCSGYINPPANEEAFSQHQLVLQLVPYMLSVSPLDCEALDYMMGFDFTYRGNHAALVAEALGTGHAMEGLAMASGAHVLNYEPSITIALEDSCRLQARLMVETRTSAYQVRKGDFPEDQISVYFTVRQYGSLEPNTTYEQTFERLRAHADNLMDTYVIDHVLRPLAQAISTK